MRNAGGDAWIVNEVENDATVRRKAAERLERLEAIPDTTVNRARH